MVTAGQEWVPLMEKCQDWAGQKVVLLAVTEWPWLVVVRTILEYLVAGFTVFSGFHYSIVVSRRLSEQQGSGKGSSRTQ